MTKLAMTLTSALASLGLAGFWPEGDEPPAPPPPPQAPAPPGEPEDVVTRVGVRAVGPDHPETVDDALNQAYDLLTRLRSERPALEGRSRELLERATQLYRMAVEAAESAEPGREGKARGLSIAAVETARAVERLREVQRGDRPADPELPPPPRRSRAGRQGVPTAPLPPIPPELHGGRLVLPVPPVPPVPPVGRLRLDAKTIEGHPGGVIVVTPRGEMLKGADGKAVRKFEVRVDEERVRELESKVRAEAERIASEARNQAGRAREQAERFRVEARRQIEQAHEQAAQAQQQARRARESARDVTIMRVVPGPREARAQLSKAYERIQQVREQAQGDDAKFYLDAARDLYNAARRDAEAGRNERAVELARAAEALTHVPAHLGAINDNDNHDDNPAPRARRDRGEIRERRREPRKSEGRTEREEHQPEARGEVAVPEEVEIHIESRPAEAPPEANADEPAPEKLTGIGAALKVEDGKVVVLNVLPDGPAGKDGRLKADDVLVGVLGDDGEKTEFTGDDLPEVVNALRGPAGTTVRLLVRPAGDEETTVYELTRDELTIPREVHETVIIEEAGQPERNAETDGDAAHPSGAPAEDHLPPPLPE